MAYGDQIFTHITITSTNVIVEKPNVIVVNVITITSENGIVECYNSIIVAGLRRILVELPSLGWPEVLPDVLAGLCMLP